jgi:hypothetical protein
LMLEIFVDYRYRYQVPVLFGLNRKSWEQNLCYEREDDSQDYRCAHML